MTHLLGIGLRSCLLLLFVGLGVQGSLKIACHQSRPTS